MDNLLFANIPHHCKDDDLRTWIEARGFEVNDLRLIRDVVSGTSPSFARVTVTKNTFDGVRVMDQQPFLGRRLFVRRGRSPLDD